MVAPLASIHQCGPEAPRQPGLLCRSRFLPLVFLGSFLLSWPLNPPASAAKNAPQASPQALLEQGRLLRNEGKDAEAVPVLERALALKKDDFDIESELGRAYNASEQYEQAAAVIERALQQGLRDYGLTVILARCYVRMGRLDRAKEVFGRAKKINPKESQAYIEQGYAHFYTGEFDAARQEFERSIAVDTSNPLGYLHLGSYLSQRGDNRAAEGYLLRAVHLLEAQPRRNPDDMAQAWVCLSDARLYQRKYRKAEAALRQGLAAPEMSPYWRAGFLVHLGRVSIDQGRIANAKRYGRRALALCDIGSSCSRPQWADIALSVIDLYAAQRHAPEAQALARRVRDAFRDAKVNSANIYQVGWLANLFQGWGDIGEAEALWDRIVAARNAVPNHRCLGWALVGLAKTRLTRGQLAEARGLYLQAIETRGLLQENAGEMADALNGLAEVYDKEGRPGEAQAARRRAAELKAHRGGS